MTLDWTLIGNWILQGAVLAIFAFAGVYLGLRFFNRKRKPDAGLEAMAQPDVAAAAVNPPEAAAVAPASPLAAAPPPTMENPPEPSQPDVQRAFEFGDDDRVMMVLELPEKMLENDYGLVETWVETVGWARVERLRMNNDQRLAAGVHHPENAPSAFGRRYNDFNPQQLQSQLDQVLSRLQISAERRRQLRQMLEANLVDADDEV